MTIAKPTGPRLPAKSASAQSRTAKRGDHAGKAAAAARKPAVRATASRLRRCKPLSAACCRKRRRKRVKHARAVFTTGILRRNPGTRYALVDLVNLGATVARCMTVQVFDWSNGLPVALNVTPCDAKVCNVSLAPGTSNFVYADISGVQFKYEVRIARPVRNRNLVLNVWGLSSEPLTPQIGNNVLQHQLFRVKADAFHPGCGCR
ncbi:hypothetical protein [Paenibacillus sp. GCM10023250]|uniref:hypothetical protein n=1 Tax=Paenibacillus sp. GCM10023250 TaxID=3252648 RepID=UPI00361724DF